MMQDPFYSPKGDASIEAVSRGPYGLLKPAASLFFPGCKDGHKCELIVKDETH